MTYDAATSSPASVRLKLERDMSTGVLEGRKLFEKLQSTMIVDRVASTSCMRFEPAKAPHTPSQYYIRNPRSETEESYTLHSNAMGQMAKQVQIPMIFVNTLTDGEDWERRELSDLLTERFNKLTFKQRGGGPPRFLNRIVGGKVLGFVSRVFRRYLTTRDMIQAFAQAATKLEAKPVEVIATELRCELKMYLPYVFEPVDKEYVAIGVVFSNSDFGRGTMRLSLCARRISSGTTQVLGEVLGESHGHGKAVGETDITLSKEAIEADIKAHKLKIRDTVNELLNPDSVNKVLASIRIAKNKDLRWDQVKDKLGKILRVKELEELEKVIMGSEEDVFELPSIPVDEDGYIQPDAWWASNLAGALADKEEGDRKTDLQKLAGTFLK